MSHNVKDGKKHQVFAKLRSEYFPIIPEVPTKQTPDWHDKNRLSRSLAAFAIQRLADVAPAQAASSVIDGGDDNGIDAICYDRITGVLWVIQAKSGDAPDKGENMKLCKGVRDLIDGKFENFNKAFERLQNVVETALNSPGTKIVACQVHQGEELGIHASQDLNELKNELNKFSNRFDWKDLTLNVVHGWLTQDHAAISVNTEISLENWFGVTNPRRAYYGLVSANQLAKLYADFGKTLFEKNIRYYLGMEEVNEAIKTTVLNDPAELFYLNNGITAICNNAQMPAMQRNEQATFTVQGLSIVNGAQTVGAIASSIDGGGLLDENAKVIFTLIEVGNQHDGIGSRITKARNTQNQIKHLNFVALDPNQERLRREMAISGIEYHYRLSEDEGGDDAITVEAAVLALAGLQNETRIVVIAKKQIGLLYDINGDIYPKLFRKDLTGVQLIRSINIYLYLNELFSNSEKAEAVGSRRKMFYRHGRLFVLHLLARKHSHLISKPEIVLSEADKLELSRLATDLAEITYTVGERKFAGAKGYLSIFNNQTDADPLAREVMQELAQRNGQTQSS